MSVTWIVLAAVGLGMYWLYLNGYLYVQNKRALTFIGSMPEKNRFAASFTSCTGTVYRVIKCREAGVYKFAYEGRTSKGTVCAQVLNGAKLPLLTLDENARTGRLMLEPKQRYYLLLRFTSSSGDCKVHWEKE